jgi:hypothetical protein
MPSRISPERRILSSSTGMRHRNANWELAARVRQQLNLKCGRYGDSEILPLSQ